MTRWGQNPEIVNIETGRGDSISAEVGTSFVAAVEAAASQANYGGYFRVFLNGAEIIDPDAAPATIEAGMRIQITSFDKVGV